MPRGFSKLLQLPEDPAAESPTNVYFRDENEDIFFTAKSAYKTPVAATTACRISESVYQVLVYLESRAVQRERNRRAALRDAGALPGGADEDPSHRRWKRRVYQLVRRRIGEYPASRLTVWVVAAPKIIPECGGIHCTKKSPVPCRPHNHVFKTRGSEYRRTWRSPTVSQSVEPPAEYRRSTGGVPAEYRRSSRGVAAE